MTDNLDAQLRMRLYRDGKIALGPGRVALLEAIGRTGSISGAARELKMSYRRAWLLVDETNNAFAQPVVESTEGGAAGGGTRLTETGRLLVEHYRRAEELAFKAATAEIAMLKNLIRN